METFNHTSALIENWMEVNLARRLKGKIGQEDKKARDQILIKEIEEMYQENLI
jgi:hypothetical protein